MNQIRFLIKQDFMNFIECNRGNKYLTIKEMVII